MRSRQGFALASAIAVVVLIGFLVTAALFATSQESRATAAEFVDARALALAENAAVNAAAAWNCPDCDLLPVGSVIIGSTQTSPPLESTVYITRLDSVVFLITGEARSTQSGTVPLRRRVSIAVRAARDSLGTMRAVSLPREFWSAAYPP